MPIDLLNQDEYLKQAAADVAEKKVIREKAHAEFVKAAIKFTNLRFKVVKYFKVERFDPQTNKMALSMYIKVRANDEKEIYIDFVSWTEYGRNVGQDTISTADPQVSMWEGIMEQDYLKAEERIYTELKIAKTGGLILAK